MKLNEQNEIDIQRTYYAETALNYNDMHVKDNDEHTFAMDIMFGAVENLGVKIRDVD